MKHSPTSLSDFMFVLRANYAAFQCAPRDQKDNLWSVCAHHLEALVEAHLPNGLLLDAEQSEFDRMVEDRAEYQESATGDTDDTSAL